MRLISLGHKRLFLSLELLMLGICAFAFGADIPVLNWKSQDDWINVKTFQANGAKGDGTTDDANAINAAFNLVGSNGKNVVYFPAGTYRISKQLTIGTSKEIQSIQILGTGRTTVIKWLNTGTDSIMFRPWGSWGSQINGITFDGNSAVRIGMYMSGIGRMYEGDLQVTNCAFKNLLGHGIKSFERYDPLNEQTLGGFNPTAEFVVRNCLFSNCKTGVASLWFNFFNWNVEGCEFVNCDIGVRTRTYGQVYVRFCHFEGSKQYDFYTEFCSGIFIRWCTSVNAQRFAWSERVFIQDCVVKGVKDQDSACVLGSTRGTHVVSDLYFKSWNSAKSPIVFSDSIYHSADDRPWVPNTASDQLLISNVQCEGTPQPATLWRGLNTNAGSHVTEIPISRRSNAMFDAEKSFLRDETSTIINDLKVPDGQVFVVTSGANLQSAINSAAAAGNGAWVYIPGSITVSQPITVSGSNYFITGTGTRSSIAFTGTAGNPVFLVNNAYNVVIANLGMRNENNSSRPATSPAIKHIGGSTFRSFVTYSRIWTLSTRYRQLSDQPSGLHFENLTSNDTVLLNQCSGEFRAKNASAGIILTLWAPMTVGVVEGATSAKTGFMGIVAANLGQMRVYNSQNLIMGTSYEEESGGANNSPTYNAYLVSGSNGDSKGRVTIGMSRYAIRSTDTTLRIQNYNGTFSGIYGEWGADDGLGATGYKFAPQAGNNPFYLLFAGATFPGDMGAVNAAQRPQFAMRSGVDSVGLVECRYWTNNMTVLPSGTQDSAKTKTAQALDDFRLLGKWAYKLDYDRSYSVVEGTLGSIGPITKNSSAASSWSPTVNLTKMGLVITHSGNISVDLFDEQGSLVRHGARKQPGVLKLSAPSAAGVYIVKVSSAGRVFTKKITFQCQLP